MDTSNPRPKWWQLYLTLPLLVVLFMGDQHLKISTGGHEAVQLGILAAVFGPIYLWLKANSAALSRMDWDQYHGTIKTTRIELYEVKVAGEERTLISVPRALSSRVCWLPSLEQSLWMPQGFETMDLCGS